MGILAEGNNNTSVRIVERVNPEVKHSEEEKERIRNAYFEHSNMRNICRIFKVSRPTLAKWLKKALATPELADTLLFVERNDVLELDEVWSFVKCRSAKTVVDKI
jgi:transposase-like protein